MVIANAVWGNYTGNFKVIGHKIMCPGILIRTEEDTLMAYDEGLSQRIRELLADQPGIDEKKMFGGLAFMVNGNMSVGVTSSDLMVRVGPDNYDTALKEPHARPMDFTGKPLRGFVYVDTKGYESDAGLAKWVNKGVDFALSLPAK